MTPSLPDGERRVSMTPDPERPVPQAEATTSRTEGASEPGKLSRAVITDVVERQTGAIKRCYERALVENESFTGTLEVGWKIQMDGSVSAVSLIDASSHNATAEDCV
ncbi:MAG TPA: AgmX/PglI C-terminal domain-containing protein, partial [Polyangia bacterium]